MKFLILISILAVGVSFSNNHYETKVTKVLSLQTDYEEGWEDGHCEGWKDVKGQYAICPITPICPIPKIDCNEGYRCGYNRGFKAGMRAARND